AGRQPSVGQGPEAAGRLGCGLQLTWAPDLRRRLLARARRRGRLPEHRHNGGRVGVRDAPRGLRARRAGAAAAANDHSGGVARWRRIPAEERRQWAVHLSHEPVLGGRGRSRCRAVTNSDGGTANRAPVDDRQPGWARGNAVAGGGGGARGAVGRRPTGWSPEESRVNSRLGVIRSRKGSSPEESRVNSRLGPVSELTRAHAASAAGPSRGFSRDARGGSSDLPSALRPSTCPLPNQY